MPPRGHFNIRSARERATSAAALFLDREGHPDGAIKLADCAFRFGLAKSTVWNAVKLLRQERAAIARTKLVTSGGGGQ